MSITSADDRITTYTPVVATTDFAADFPVFDNDDLIVVHDGVKRDDFSVSATYVEGISINAKCVFAVGIIGDVKVVGRRVPRRKNRFNNGGPLPIRDQNLALDTLEGEMQEARRDVDRSVKTALGSSGPIITVGSAGQIPVFDADGNMIPSTPNGSGNMIREIYDPQNIGDDAFNLSVHTGVTPPESVNDASIVSPSVIANRIADLCDIRDYDYGTNLLGQYAVEKIQAAIDANESDILLFPQAVIPISDSIVPWRTMTFRGIKDEMWWREFGDSTGGVTHPQIGTIFWTEGAGVARRWTSMEDADDPINPMIVYLGSMIETENISFRTGVRTDTPGLSGSSEGWHSARFIPGTRGHRANHVSVQGLGTVGFKHALYIDGTNSKYNTALLSLPHYSNVNSELFDVGPTDIRDSNIIYAAVRTVRVQGRTGSFPGGQNPYAPNGMSDLKIEGHFYNDGPLADRQDHGALIDIDFAFPINWSDGSNGAQNATFIGRFDCSGKYSIKMKRARAVRAFADYNETSPTYQAATPAAPRAIVQTDSTYSGDLAIVCGKWFSNIKVDDGGTETSLVNFSNTGVLGRRLHYDGLESGEMNTMFSRTGGWTNNTIPEVKSTAASGEIRYVEVAGGAKDTYIRKRKRASGKGEQSFDGVSWHSYEEGTWTPGIAGKTTPGTYTLTSGGSWTRNGRTVRVCGWILLSAISVAATGQIVINGLPFVSRNNTAAVAATSFANLNGLALTASTILAGYVAPNTQQIELSMRSNVADANLASANLSATSRIYFEVTYEVA